MKSRNKLLAVGLSLSASFTACTDGNTEVFRVGENKWVEVTQAVVQKYRNGEKTLNPGDTCNIQHGSFLVLREGGIKYKNEKALGTECPDGATIDLTVGDAKNQEVEYKKFETRQKEVVDQVSNMSRNAGPISEVVRGWVDLVNPNPLEVGSRELEYGDSCFAEGLAQNIGQLSTGELVMLQIDGSPSGTQCPTGAVYLVAQP